MLWHSQKVFGAAYRSSKDKSQSVCDLKKKKKCFLRYVSEALQQRPGGLAVAAEVSSSSCGTSSCMVSCLREDLATERVRS